MTIKFIKNYEVGQPPEVFTIGQEVGGRSPESELHFVRRGVAGYLQADGSLRDQDGNVLLAPAGAEEASTPQRKGPGDAVVKTTASQAAAEKAAAEKAAAEKAAAEKAAAEKAGA